MKSTTKAYGKIGNMCFHGYDTEKDLKKATEDIDRVLRLLSQLSVSDVIKTLEPYRQEFAKNERWSKDI